MGSYSLSNIKIFLLDMDGTIYLGNKIIEGSLDFINALRDKGKGYIFITNNSSKNASAYLRKLKSLKIKADRENLIISTDLLIYYLNAIKPGATLFPIGTKQFEKELINAGFNLISNYETTISPDYVVVAFDTSLNYSKLFGACSYIRNGIPYIATHPDFNCPLENGIYMPDCGAIIAFIKASTGISPLEIVGKPNATVVEMILDRGFKRDEVAMVGDRLYTDIKLGQNSGIVSILVLSGESSREDLTKGEFRPDYIFNSVKDIISEI